MAPEGSQPAVDHVNSEGGMIPLITVKPLLQPLASQKAAVIGASDENALLFALFLVLCAGGLHIRLL